MWLGNAQTESLRGKSLCQGTKQTDTFCNERSVPAHKSSLSGINKNRIKVGTFCLYVILSKKVLSLEHNTRKHYLLIYSNKVRLSNVFHPSCGICAVYYQYWLLKPRSQLSAKHSAVTWVLSSKLSMSLREMGRAVKPVICFNGPDIRQKFCHGRWSCLLILTLLHWEQWDCHVYPSSRVPHIS